MQVIVVSDKHMRSIRWLLIFLILSAGAILRVAYLSNTLIIDPIRADAAYHLIYANNLLEDATFSKDRSDDPVPDSYWAPGYPAFLAAVIKVSELLSVDAYNAILFCQLLLGVGTVFLCFLVGVSFLPGYWPLLPAFLAALSPHLVSSASYVLTETLFGFLLILALYTLSRALEGGNSARWLWAGASFAVAYMVNPVSLFLAPLLAVALLFTVRIRRSELSPRELYRLLAIFLAPLVIISMLWTIRSAVSVPVGQETASNRLLTNLVIGMYPEYHDKWRASIMEPEKKVVIPGAGVNESYGTFLTVLSDRFLQNPLETVAWYLIQKPILLWDWNIRTGFGDIYIYRVEYSLYHTSTPAMISYSFMATLHSWVLLGSIIGLVFLYGQGGRGAMVPALLYIALIYVSLIYVISQSEPRYSIPLRTELYLCFTYFLWQLFSLIGRLRKRS
ncbi:MAG: 4-amino-4-deoxy-L-arabinose transferase-like glycosyltransferase [Halioglobus sp.]|jgi:4-amino-4-deoxy-L-arabinose transferase-like glycosyltransferase